MSLPYPGLAPNVALAMCCQQNGNPQPKYSTTFALEFNFHSIKNWQNHQWSVSYKRKTTIYIYYHDDNFHFSMSVTHKCWHIYFQLYTSTLSRRLSSLSGEPNFLDSFWKEWLRYRISSITRCGDYARVASIKEYCNSIPPSSVSIPLFATHPHQTSLQLLCSCSFHSARLIALSLNSAS